ncbi:ABC transporter permease [Variovorax sp. LG9.2]|uniref:ABC transporter permease n=1 Tax=Variovorax sp. LG9.2 TaxID=3048626 RepID=UPI002B2251BE|nr:ABC transporter permease [Variovorax sp. LG9.2]MEB0060285.1 ABC transporter permease [Variovorax sp. LG9.2]
MLMQSTVIKGLLASAKYYLGLIVLLAIGVLASPHDADGGNIFMSGSNLSDVFRQVSNIGIISIGMTLVIIAGGIDLSVGSIMSLGSVLTAMLLTQAGWTGASSFGLAASVPVAGLLVWVAVRFFRSKTATTATPNEGRDASDPKRVLAVIAAPVAGLGLAIAIAVELPSKLPLGLVLLVVPLAGCAMGMLNGWIITRGRMQPFIVTLASMVAITGATRLISGQDTAVHAIYSGTNATTDIEALRALLFGIVPVPALFFLGTALIFGFVLSRTVFGKYLYAIGGNEKCARLSGLRVDRHKIATYAISGLLSALVGVLFAAQFRQGKSDAGLGWELDAIAAVVIGGTTLMGGAGRISGTIAGVLIFGFLGNILLLNNIDSNTQLLLKGIIIIVAVFLQQTPLSRLGLTRKSL